jgi:demethylmenaquinone methyltransferase/2-methoxy-6-polyprenyl-1,4-benzoquinol methylase
VKAYYDARAPEYDEWYDGLGRYERLDRPGWEDEVRTLLAIVGRLPPKRTLDVACGTGYLTRHLPGDVVGLDQSRKMLAIARRRLPGVELVHAGAWPLPFEDGSFGRVFTAHFYGHLDEGERRRFLSEARRVGSELVVVDSALRAGVEPEEWQERILNDGSRWTVYKRYFAPDELLGELGGRETLHAGRWFVAVRA